MKIEFRLEENPLDFYLFRDPNKLKYESLPSGCVSDVGNENKGRRGEKKRKKRRKEKKKINEGG